MTLLGKGLDITYRILCQFVTCSSILNLAVAGSIPTERSHGTLRGCAYRAGVGGSQGWGLTAQFFACWLDRTAWTHTA